MRCRHCGVEIRESMGDMWAGPDNYWTCESVPQDMGGTNHEPGDPFTVGTRVRMARPMTVNGRLSRLTAVGEEGTVMEEHHVNSNDNPAVAHVRWDNGDEWWADRECMDVIGQERPGSSSPRPIPSVNEGRLDINIGTTCERCRSVIQRGRTVGPVLAARCGEGAASHRLPTTACPPTDHSTHVQLHLHLGCVDLLGASDRVHHLHREAHALLTRLT